MDDKIEALEAELAKMQQTLNVVRMLKPIQRQQDSCLGLLRTHVATMADTLAEPEAAEDQAKGAAAAGSALPGGDTGEGSAAIG